MLYFRKKTRRHRYAFLSFLPHTLPVAVADGLSGRLPAAARPGGLVCPRRCGHGALFPVVLCRKPHNSCRHGNCRRTASGPTMVFSNIGAGGLSILCLGTFFICRACLSLVQRRIPDNWSCRHGDNLSPPHDQQEIFPKMKTALSQLTRLRESAVFIELFYWLQRKDAPLPAPASPPRYHPASPRPYRPQHQRQQLRPLPFPAVSHR